MGCDPFRPLEGAMLPPSYRSFLGSLAFAMTTGCARSAAPASSPEPQPAVEQATPAPQARSLTPARDTTREFRGAYTRGFEASWFVPCDAPLNDALWWVTLTEDARLQRDSLLKTLTRPATGALAVRWRGTTSARMPAGQMGRGSRYMLVTEILEGRPLPSEGAGGPWSEKPSEGRPCLSVMIESPALWGGAARVPAGRGTVTRS